MKQLWTPVFTVAAQKLYGRNGMVDGVCAKWKMRARCKEANRKGQGFKVKTQAGEDGERTEETRLGRKKG